MRCRCSKLPAVVRVGREYGSDLRWWLWPIAAAACAELSLGGAASPGVDGPWFVDVTHQAGVDRPHRTRQFENPYAKIMAGYTALGASAAVADYDGDGFEDVFVTDSSREGRNHLYHNNGDFTF